jgi:hypothetical protein
MWTARERPCVSLRAYPASGIGAMALASDLASAGWRRRLARQTRGAA